jgi:hypothetical protein
MDDLDAHGRFWHFMLPIIFMAQSFVSFLTLEQNARPGNGDKAGSDQQRLTRSNVLVCSIVNSGASSQMGLGRGRQSLSKSGCPSSFEAVSSTCAVDMHPPCERNGEGISPQTPNRFMPATRQAGDGVFRPPPDSDLEILFLLPNASPVQSVCPQLCVMSTSRRGASSPRRCLIWEARAARHG